MTTPSIADRAGERRAPVQGYEAGIPWEMHLRAYDVYKKKYGAQQALIEGWCRGGFATSELDVFIPGWREELSERTAFLKQIADLTAERDSLLREIKSAREDERAKIVATIRAEAEATASDEYAPHHLASNFRRLANTIERGDHLPPAHKPDQSGLRVERGLFVSPSPETPSQAHIAEADTDAT